MKSRWTNMVTRIFSNMKFAMLLAASFGVAKLSAQTSYKVDPATSTIKWNGSKVVGGGHYGSVKLASGSLQVTKGKLVDGEFIADMKTLTVDDLTGGMAEKLGGHLVSGDFFGVEEHPTAKFDITKVTPTTAGKATVTGKLTIKGKTDEVTFPVTYTVGTDGVVTAEGKVTVDRTKYDVRYGSASFFNDLGDKAISDEFTLDVVLKAKKA